MDDLTRMPPPDVAARSGHATDVTGTEVRAWWLTQERFESRWNMTVRNGTGPLTITGDRITYTARNLSIRGRATGVSLVRQAVPWGAWALSIVVLAVFILAMVRFDLTAYALPGLIGGAIGAVMGTVVQAIQKFVRVEGISDAGAPFVVHLHQSSAGGWSGLMGGNTGIYERLAAAIADPSPDASPTSATP